MLPRPGVTGNSPRLPPLVFALLAILLLAGCAGQPVPSLTPLATLSPTVEPIVTATATLPDGGGPSGGLERLVALTRDDLGKRLGVPPEEVDFLGSEERQWSDSSLGCPQRGYSYLQVITPGYIIRHSAGGATYQYHTDQRLAFVLCEGTGLDRLPSPTGTSR